jgi:MFS family permease
MTEVDRSIDLRRARIAVFGAFLVHGLTLAAVITRLPSFKVAFALDDAQLLLLAVEIAAMSAFGSICAGYVAERNGSARTLRVGLAGLSVGAFAVALSWDATSLIVMIAVYGFFFGASDASVNMQGVAVQERHGRSIMVSFHAAWSAAAVVGALYASMSIELGWSLAHSLGLVSAVGLLGGVVTGRGLLHSEPAGHMRDGGTPPRRMSWGPVLLISIPAFAIWFVDGATANWSGLYLLEGLVAAPSVAPLAYAAYQAALMVVRLLGDPVVRRFGPAVVVRDGGIVALVGVALLVAAPTTELALVGFVLLGAGVAMVPALVYGAAAQLDGGTGNVAVARVNVANYVGYISGTVAIGIVAGVAGDRFMYVALIVVVPLVTLTAARFRPPLLPDRTHTNTELTDEAS